MILAITWVVIVANWIALYVWWRSTRTLRGINEELRAEQAEADNITLEVTDPPRRQLTVWSLSSIGPMMRATGAETLDVIGDSRFSIPPAAVRVQFVDRRRRRAREASLAAQRDVLERAVRSVPPRPNA